MEPQKPISENGSISKDCKEKAKNSIQYCHWRPAAIVSEGWTVSEATSQIQACKIVFFKTEMGLRSSLKEVWLKFMEKNSTNVPRGM